MKLDDKVLYVGKDGNIQLGQVVHVWSEYTVNLQLADGTFVSSVPKSYGVFTPVSDEVLLNGLPLDVLQGNKVDETPEFPTEDDTTENKGAPVGAL